MSIGRGVATNLARTHYQPFEARVTMTNVIPLPTPEKGLAHPPLDRRSPFRGWDRGEEIAATYHAHDTRAVVGKAINGRGGKEVLALILGAIDAGILTPPGKATKRPSLRLLVPDGPIKYCNQFDLTNQAHRKKVREVIWPAILANKDEVLANPGDLENIIKADAQRKAQAAAALRREEEIARKVVEVRAAGQEPCIMYGVQLWPRMDERYGTYDNDQIRLAAWTFRDWVMYLEKRDSPGTKAINVRNMIRRLLEYYDRIGDKQSTRAKRR